MAISPTKIYFFNLFVKICPPTRCNTLKVKLLKWAGARVGRNVQLFSPKILGNFELIIGDNCFIGHDSFIMGCDGSKIEMKPFSKLGSKTILVTGYHDYNPKYDCVAGPGLKADITIEEGACISTNSMICPGKKVGKKAHVAACSVVTHDVPPYTRVAGVPARVIKEWSIASETENLHL